MEKKIKLSFCMIVKNEEENLKRCLDSLKPVLQKPHVELVILDTGSTDNTVEIAKSYTDKVYFAEWNNNFSDMRNKAIAYTSGEWLFSLDADETLETPNELISLLQSGALSGKMSVMVKIKSYFYKNNLEKYLLESNFKLFRNDEDFCYKGAIHNQPNVKKPILVSDILLNHYGYLLKDKNLMEKKFKRTGTILKQELKKDPDNIYYSFQLAVSYSMYGKHEEALNQIRKTYKLIMNKDFNSRKKYAFIYSVYSKNAFACNQYQEVLEIASEGIRLRPDYLDLYNILGYTYYKIGNLEKMKQSFQNYLRLYRKKERLDVYNDASVALYTIDQYSLNKVHTVLANYYLENNELNSSLKHISEISEDTEDKLILLTRIYMKNNEINEIKELLEVNELVYNKITIIVEEMKKSLEMNDQTQVNRVFSQGKSLYSEYCTLCDQEHIEDDKIVNFLEKVDFSYRPFFYIKMLKKIPFSKRIVNLFKNEDQIIVLNLFKYLIRNDYHYEQKLIEEILNIEVSGKDIRSITTLLSVYRAILENSNDYSDEVDLMYFEVFSKYIYYGELLVKYIYGEEKLRIISKHITDKEHKFFINFHYIKKIQSSSNLKLAVNYLKEAKDNFPFVSNYIKKYAKLNLIQ